MEKKYKLEIIGITFNQIESGVYALILQQEGTSIRIPIIIGFPEAQAIECKLQEISTPRPLTHDTMVNALMSFGIELKEVNIKKLPNGIFAADLVFTNGNEESIVDARSSDAIALAIRTGAPIFTSESVLLESGFDASGESNGKINPEILKESENKNNLGEDLSKITIEKLNNALNSAVENENYEEAARIKKEIERRNNPGNDKTP